MEIERLSGLSSQELANLRLELSQSAAAVKSARMEMERLSGQSSRELANLRLELSQSVAAEKSARTEIERLSGLSSQELANLRLELSQSAAAEKSARMEIERLSGLSSRELANLRLELSRSVAAEKSARTEMERLSGLLRVAEENLATKLKEKSDRQVSDSLVGGERIERIAVAEVPAPSAGSITNPNTEGADLLKPAAALLREPSAVNEPRAAAVVTEVAQPSSEHAKMIARAQALIGQGDVAGGRRFLEPAVRGGSARAAFLLAETYDWRALRALKVHGLRGDTKRALELYRTASQGGIAIAKERMSQLEGSDVQQ
jgi:hypothetical protein